MTVSFVSLGCRVNQYEIQALREAFTAAGYTEVAFSTPSDICVINTCAVTAESEKKSRHTVSRAARLSGKVIVTGCYAELCRKTGISLPNVFYLGGNGQKSLIPSVCDGIRTEYNVNTAYDSGLSIGHTGSLPNERYRAYVKIEDGCNGRCSYCVIPFMRGRSYVRDEADILDEVRRLSANGVSEVIFTGIEVSDYGSAGLASLIAKTAETDIRRIRLGSLNPNVITKEFTDTIANTEKFCRHIHISVQSASGHVLAGMRRPYSASKLIDVTERLYAAMPDVMLTADIISGFPGETDEDFAETVEYLKKYRFMHVHAFPFSSRPFTDAPKLPGQIDEAEKARRNAEIIAVSDENKRNIALSMQGTHVEVLVEKKNKSVLYGHTAGFMEAGITGTDAAPGDYVNATVTGFSADGILVCDGTK